MKSPKTEKANFQNKTKTIIPSFEANRYKTIRPRARDKSICSIQSPPRARRVIQS